MSNCTRIFVLILTSLLMFPTEGAASPESGAVEATGSNEADLAVTKSSAPNPVPVGQTLTYTIIVTNNGPAVSRPSASIVDNLPATFDLTSSSVPCDQVGTVLTCFLGPVEVDEVITVTIEGTPTTEGTITNTVTVRGDIEQDDFTPANNIAVESTTVGPAGAGIPALDWRGLLVMIALMAIAGMAIRR